MTHFAGGIGSSRRLTSMSNLGEPPPHGKETVDYADVLVREAYATTMRSISSSWTRGDLLPDSLDRWGREFTARGCLCPVVGRAPHAERQCGAWRL